MSNHYNKVIFDSFDLSRETYNALNEDVKLAILRYYWNKKMNPEGKREDIKSKVLSIIKRK